jgi:PAS domain S-box-containing protein
MSNALSTIASSQLEREDSSTNRGSEELFERLIDSVHDYAIFRLSPSGIITSWNSGAERISGYTATEIIGEHFSVLYTPEALARDWPAEELRRASSDGRLEDEGWRVRKDGSRFWANVIISPIRDKSEGLVGYAKVTRDLTERREAELRLRESERNQRLLLDSVQDYAIFTLDPDGIITSWNLGAQRIKGYSAAQAIGKHFSIFYTQPAIDTGWPQEELRRALAFGRLEDEGWRVRQDGSLFWANVVITAILDEHGACLGYSKVTRDLTERRRHEEELRSRERDLRLLIDGVKDHAMFLLDPAGRVRTWNSGAERVLGWSAEEAAGRDVFSFYAPADQATGRPTAELAAAAATGSFQIEGWRRRSDGTDFWAEVQTTVLRENGKRLEGFVQIVRDLTERRRVEALEREGERVNHFISLLSHELRNPLAPIQNAATLLTKLTADPQIRWCAEMIDRQTGHLTRLVDDLLDVNRIVSGKVRVDLLPLDLNAVVRLAVEAERGTALQRGLSLVVDLPEDPTPVVGDATRLNQVIVNLLVNARKFTPQGGRIQLLLERRGRLACVQVIDTGIGMSDDLLRNLFKPFVQGSPTLDRTNTGLGLGLALVKGIVEMHGGTVNAASPGLTLGSTFTLTLPLAGSETSASGPDVLREV